MYDELKEYMRGRENEVEQIRALVEEKMLEEDGILRLQKEYMETVQKRRPDFRILIKIYQQRVFKEIQRRDKEGIEREVRNFKNIWDEEKREKFRKIYKKYIKENKEEGYVNIEFKCEEDYVFVLDHCIPYKLNEEDICYISDGWRVAAYVYDFVLEIVERGDKELLGWWIEDYSKRLDGFEDIHVVLYLVEFLVLCTEEIELLTFLKERYGLYKRGEEERKENLLSHTLSIEQVLEEAISEEMVEWWEEYLLERQATRRQNNDQQE